MTANNNTLPIGFFDSGVGGLSVYARFRESLPNENTLYFGDLIHLPYGNKTKEELIGFGRNILNFYKKTGVKAVVIACNTSSAQAYDELKGDYDFKIYPIIQSCAKVIASMPIKKIGVFATEATVKAGAYTRELKKYNSDLEVKELARKNWVSIVEGSVDNAEELKLNIKDELDEMMKFEPDKIILGCTHYPYLMNEFKKYLPADLFVDPAKIFVDYIKQDLNDNLNHSSKIGEEKFFVTANPLEFVKNAKIFYDVKSEPILVSV